MNNQESRTKENHSKLTNFRPPCNSGALAVCRLVGSCDLGEEGLPSPPLSLSLSGRVGVEKSEEKRKTSSTYQFVCSTSLEQAEADSEDDDDHLYGEEEDDGEDDGGQVGGGQGGDRGEAAVEEERVVRRWHEDTLGVLRYQPEEIKIG